MPIILAWLVFAVGCQQVNEFNWSIEFQNNPDGTLEKLALEPSEQKALIGIQLLQKHPDSARQICNTVNIEPLNTQCARFISRPHLSTIKPKDDGLIWTGGTFNQRIFFPELRSVTAKPQCTSDQLSCIQAALSLLIESERSQDIPTVCVSYSTKRGQGDCFFQASEAWVNRHGGYSDPADLCRLSGAYSAECHHHLLLALAIRHQSNADGHLKQVSEIKTYWKDHPAYALQLIEVYWSIVSSRVAGVIQPFRWSEWGFIPSNHLHSAIGMRLIRHEQSLETLEQLLIVDEYRLEKAYGPGTPFFVPRQVWSDESKPQLYFCDIRGGLRPTHLSKREDILISMVTAAAMLNPPDTTLIEEINQIHPELFDRTAIVLND